MKRLLLTISLIAGIIAAFISCEEQEQTPEIIKVESVTIDQADLTLTEGESVTLTATVLPEDAADKTVAWDSSNEDIVMVSSSGKVQALAVGAAQITAEVGSKTDFIRITVKAKPGSEDDPALTVTGNAEEITATSAKITGYANLPLELGDASFGIIYSTANPPSVEDGTIVRAYDIDANNMYVVNVWGLSSETTYYYASFVQNGLIYRFGAVKSFSTAALPDGAVDLGLSVYWAACNLGASKSDDCGDYYAWGETETKSDYNWSTYKWCNGSYDSLTKYNSNSSYGTVDNKIVLEPDDDVAHVKLGGSWRMPTTEEWNELLCMCTWTWTTENGINGRKVIGPNGNSIFLPAAGGRNYDLLYGVGSSGYYWSSSLETDNPDHACGVYFNSDNMYSYHRFRGQSVRPVTE